MFFDWLSLMVPNIWQNLNKNKGAHPVIIQPKVVGLRENLSLFEVLT